MRGVVWAFSDLMKQMDHMSRIDFAKWFTEGLNIAYDSGWLQFTNLKLRKHLRHLAEDHNETIINYRLDDAEKALGPHVAILVGAFSSSWPETHIVWEEFAYEHYQTLESTLVRGYKKEVRPQLLNQYPEPGRERNQAVLKEAKMLAAKQISEFKKIVEEVRA